MKTTSWVVAHSGARDEYQLPLALHESHSLEWFVTDWYSPMDTPILGRVLNLTPSSVRSLLLKRYRHGLPSALVKDQKLRELLNVMSLRKADMAKDRYFAEYAAKIATEKRSNFLTTTYYGWASFPLLPPETVKVLLQLQAHPWYLRDVYSKYPSENGKASELMNEFEMKAEPEFLKTWGQESLDADLLIATSTFTKRSLIYAGVSPGKIMVLPYGIDSELFRNDLNRPSGCPKVLFVGHFAFRKGFWNLLSQWNRIDYRDAQLHIVGGDRIHDPGFRSDPSLIWHGRIKWEQLIPLMNQVDLLVLPSISDGFGHVLLQSLSCGTPILASDTTAGPDLLQDWEEGFIFPSGDWNALGAQLNHWISHVDRLRALRGAARAIALRHPWAGFREGIRKACDLAVATVAAGRN